MKTRKNQGNSQSRCYYQVNFNLFKGIRKPSFQSQKNFRKPLVHVLTDFLKA
jgi:hypothetical protein